MSTRAKRRASISNEVAGLQERVRKSILGLPSYIASRLYEETYAELSRLAPSLQLTRTTTLDAEVVDEVDFFQDMSLLVVLIQRAAAISDAQLLIEKLHELFDEADEEAQPRTKKLRGLAESLELESLLPERVKSAPSSDMQLLSKLQLEAWIIWFQLRALRSFLRDLLAADGIVNGNAPTPLPDLIRISDSSSSRIRSRLTALAADKSVYRKDNAMKVHGLQRQSTSSLPMKNGTPFHLDWKSHPSLSKAQNEADALSESSFFKQCHQLATLSPCGFTSPSSESYTLLTTFANLANHHWTESVISALGEQAAYDPLDETLLASLPQRLLTLTLPSSPSILIEDSPLILRRPNEEQRALLRLMSQISEDPETSSSAEERAFWGLLAGNFEAATSLSTEAEEIALAGLVSMSRHLAVRSGSEEAEGDGHWRTSIATEAADESAALAKEGVQERLKTFASVIHRTGAVEDCCAGIFKSLRNAYAPKQSLAFDCLTLLASGPDAETREALISTILSAVSGPMHPLTAMAAMEFVLSWTTAAGDLRAVLDSDGAGADNVACPPLLISAYVNRFCELQESSTDESETQYTFVLESCKLADSTSRENALARLLVCQIRRDAQDATRRGRDVWQRGLSCASKGLIDALAREFPDDILRFFELATHTLLTQTQQLLELLTETASVTHEEVLGAHAQALVCIQSLAFAAPECSAPIPDDSDPETLLRRFAKSDLGQSVAFSPRQNRLSFLTRMASLGTLMGLAADVLESVYFDNLSTPERNVDDYQTPKPIWGASARSRRGDQEDEEGGSATSGESEAHFVNWESATSVREIRKVDADSPLQPAVTAHEILRKSFFRNVLIPLQEIICSCSDQQVSALNTRGQTTALQLKPLPQCMRLPDYREDDPLEKPPSNPLLIAVKEFLAQLPDVELIFTIHQNEILCASILPFRQFQSILSRRSLRAVITRCGVSLCQSRPSNDGRNTRTVKRVMSWIETFVAPSLKADFFPLGSTTDTETFLDPLALSLRSELGTSSRLENRRLLHRFKNILCVEKESAQALRECQDLENLFAQFDPVDEEASFD